jgi:hypothetical protein
MHRRSTALLIVWAALFAAGSPAAACAASAGHHDCCPSKTESPCDHEGRQQGTTVAKCCTPVGHGAQGALIDSRGGTQKSWHDAAGPDSPAIHGSAAALLAPTLSPARKTRAETPPDASAQLTYLRTGRLRL